MTASKKGSIKRSSADGQTDSSEHMPPFPGDDETLSLSEAEQTTCIRTRSGKNEPQLPAPPYSRFGRREKFMLVVQCAFTGFFSTITGAIYHPVLTFVENRFNITEDMVNITVVVYLTFEIMAPSPMDDSFGRRQIVLFSVMVYFCACVGLACAQTYGQILGLRCLQAAGIAPVIAINSGIMGDITTRAERGGYVGYVSGFQVVGSAFGALIGAGLSSRWGWRAIFWFLAFGSGACLMVSIAFSPESKRSIAGNGSVTPKSSLSRSPFLLFSAARRKLHLNHPGVETLETSTPLNILAPFGVLTIPEVSLLLSVAGVQFITWTTQQTALATALSENYHLSLTKVGLCFLPAGVCTLIGMDTSSRYLNYSSRGRMKRHQEWLKSQEEKLLQEHEGDVERVRHIMEGDYHYSFNILRARLQPAIFTVLLSSAGFIAFGWCLHVKAPLAAVLCMSGFASLFSNCILTMSVTVIVDLFPSKASTATGCLNFFRCILSAIFIATLTKMTKRMTSGGVFTFLGGLTALSGSLLLIIIAQGKKLSHKRRQQERKLLEQKDAS